MKLTELNPRWYSVEGVGRVGFTFECPHCSASDDRQRLGVAVHDDGLKTVSRAEPDAHGPGYVWEMTGTDFHDISLMPSVDASKVGHWHGFITNGEVT